MNCPACGSPLRERKTNTGALLLVCSRWPTCKVAGSPELLERMQVPVQRPEPVKLGEFVRQVAQLRIHQSKLRKAKTKEQREAVRLEALEALR